MSTTPAFIPPHNFDEFYERYGWWLRHMAAQFTNYTADPEQLDELEQEFALKLIQGSGVERFDPTIYGDDLNERLFYAYIYMVLQRHYWQLCLRKKRNRRRVSTESISMETVIAEHDEQEQTIAHTITDQNASERALEARIALRDVQKQISSRLRPKRAQKYLDLIDAMLEVGTKASDITEYMGVGHSVVYMRLQNLGKLLRRWERQRK